MSRKRFSRIKFDNICYDSDKAKKILGQLMEVVEDLIRATYPGMRRRGRPTESKGYGVWDVFCVRKNFREHPHFTIGIQPQKAVVALTIPNRAPKKKYWDRAIELEEYRKIINEIMPELPESRSNFYFWLEQRHSKDGTPRGELIEDATMKVNPEVDEKYTRQNRKIKRNRCWMESLRKVLSRKSKANMQLQFCVEYMYYECPIVKKPEFANQVSSIIISFSPLYHYFVKGS